AGNLRQKADDGTVWTYDYAVEQRLVQVAQDGELRGSYAYDPFNRRLSKQTAVGMRYFLYADEGLVAELDAAGQVLTSYGYMPDTHWTTAPQWAREAGNYAYFGNDHLATPRLALTSNGRVRG